VRKWIKTRFKALLTVKKIFFEEMFLVVWKCAQMEKNTFLSTPDGQKIFFEEMFLVVWKCAQMDKNTFLSTPDGQKNLF
jgi:hypothetical protein